VKIWTTALLPAPATAQGTTFPDVPANHWAYQAVTDLANKGYVKGYPNGQFLGKRSLTRYEFATVIDRMAQTIEDLSTTVKAGQAVTTPTGTPVTQDDLNKINALVSSFQTQLAAIQSTVNGDPATGTVGFQDQIDALRQDVLDTKDAANKAQAAADNSFGIGGSRKFQVTGYIQARYQQAGKSQAIYPNGNATTSGAYNGNYAQGNNNESFQLRRSRLKFIGQVTPNTKFAIQLDASGAIVGGTSAANQQVTVREGYVQYTFGDGNPLHGPSITAGQFATPFGYQLPASSAAILTPERPLAFSETGPGLFANQDYDKGIQLGYNTQNQLAFLPAGIKFTAALINGNGRVTEDTDRHIDQVYRLAYQTSDKQFALGTSYYLGQIGIVGATPGPGGVGTVSDFGAGYPKRRKQLFGADLQYTSNSGPFLLGEYVNGIYEQRTYFGVPTFTGANPLGLTSNVYAPGNRIEGYYGQVGYTFNKQTANPLAVFFSYDKLRRASGSNGNGSYDDENLGYGASYFLDKATRFRLYYIRPDKVAHAPTAPNPLKISETIGEIQVAF